MTDAHPCGRPYRVGLYLRLKAERLDVEADRFQRQLETLGPATLGVLA